MRTVGILVFDDVDVSTFADAAAFFFQRRVMPWARSRYIESS